MSEAPIKVENAPSEEIQNWKITGRPFERDKNDFSSRELEAVEEKFGGWNKFKYQLGFLDEDVAEWKKSQCAVLEVGPGTGDSTEQLLEKGVNIFALEPSLKYNNEGSTLGYTKKTFSRPEFEGKVSAANAADAALAFPGQKFDVAFAIGVNFQNYSLSEVALINQIRGVLAALTDTTDSYFTFSTSNNEGTVTFNFLDLHGQPRKKFDLISYLNDYGIRYTLHDVFDDKTSPISGATRKAIRIYKQSADGEDTVKKLDQVITKDVDLSKYTKPLIIPSMKTP